MVTILIKIASIFGDDQKNCHFVSRLNYHINVVEFVIAIQLIQHICDWFRQYISVCIYIWSLK